MTNPLTRREVLAGTLGVAVAAQAQAAPLVEVEEKTLAELSTLLDQGATTSKALVQAYLARIEKLDRAGPTLRSVLETNPQALVIAEALDAERAAKKVRGPLHGIPVVVKDNLDTADQMKTTAGSLALMDAPTPAKDSFVVQRLREAGAVILGKTNLSEWANLRGNASSSGWSGRGGQTRNPYVLERNPSGSSSGSGAAVAASLCAAAIGTETDGSIVSPSCSNGLVGLKPTVGLVSRSGIIPISHTQDTAGPMTRSVRDAALVLDAIVGVDPSDAATTVKHPVTASYTAALAGASLKGAKLGLIKNLMTAHRAVGVVATNAAKLLRDAGATLVEVELKSDAYGEAEFEVLLTELKADLEAYLTKRGGPLKTLESLIAFNTAHAEQELALFGQESFVEAAKRGPLSSEKYKKALATCGQARRDLEALFQKHSLDALVGPTGSPAWFIDPVNGDAFGFSGSTAPAVAGFPHLVVPMGFVSDLPVTLSFIGRAWSEAKLLGLGFAFEQLSHARRAPQFLSVR